MLHTAALVVLSLGQAADDRLLARLDADFERLVAAEPQAEKTRQAARLLHATNDSDRWTNYSAATRLLRETRPKSGIPLLLAYMVRHTSRSSSHISVPEYAQTLTILTGKEIANPYQYVQDRETPVRRAVEKLVAEWWEPQQDKITTDINEWTPEQVRVLAAKIYDRAAYAMRGSSTDPEEWRSRPTSYAIYHLLYYHVMQAGSDAPDWRLDELHPRMAAAFLAPAGYRTDARSPPARDTSRPAYASVALLAALRRNGELENLDEIAEDKNQAAGTRLTCAMALFRADEKLRTDILLEVAANDRNLERRLVATLALKYAADDRAAGALLTRLLDDDNAEVRSAAISALVGPRPPQAVPKLKQAIDAVDPPQAMTFAFYTLREYKSRDACEALAGFLAAGLEDRRKTEHLYNALSAFESATGKSWNPPGLEREALYREIARLATEWWKTEGRRTFE